MLEPKVVRLILQGSYAVLSSLTPDGQPAATMMWVDQTGSTILLNTEVDRKVFSRLGIGASASLLIFESSRSWVEVRGRVTKHHFGMTAREHLDRLAMRYLGHEYRKEIRSQRVIIEIQPEHQHIYMPQTAGSDWRF